MLLKRQLQVVLPDQEQPVILGSPRQDVTGQPRDGSRCQELRKPGHHPAPHHPTPHGTRPTADYLFSLFGNLGFFVILIILIVFIILQNQALLGTLEPQQSPRRKVHFALYSCLVPGLHCHCSGTPQIQSCTICFSFNFNFQFSIFCCIDVSFFFFFLLLVVRIEE